MFQIAVRQLFDNDPSHAISNLIKDDIRIIVGLFYEEKARKVFCKVSLIQSNDNKTEKKSLCFQGLSTGLLRRTICLVVNWMVNINFKNKNN